jgi:hypothetical protein
MSRAISYKLIYRPAAVRQQRAPHETASVSSVAAAQASHTHPAPPPNINTSKTAPSTSPSPTRRTHPPSTRVRACSRRTAGTASARADRASWMIHRGRRCRCPRPCTRHTTAGQTTCSRSAKRRPSGQGLAQMRSSRESPRWRAAWGREVRCRGRRLC